MKRLLLVALLVLLITPAVALAADGICVIKSSTNGVPQCLVKTDGTTFDGTSATCNAALTFGFSAYIPDVTDKNSQVQCNVGFCCAGQSGSKVGVTALCANGSAPNPNNMPYSTSVETGCPTPPKPNCPTGTLAAADCVCNGQNMTAGKICCADGTSATPPAVCSSAPPTTPSCTPGAVVPASGCLCGSGKVTTGICCTGGVAIPSGSCPTTTDSTLCGNYKKDGAEECDAPAVIPIGSTQSLYTCPATKVCTASCTCINATATICGDGICGPGEQNTCLRSDGTPIDCPVPPKACSPGSAGYAAPASFTAVYNEQTRSIDVRWAALPTDGCTPTGFLIGVSNTTEPIAKVRPDTIITDALIAPNSTSFVDTTPRTQTKLVYTLIAVYSGGTANTTTTVWKPTPECPVKDASFCLDTKTAITCTGYTARKTVCNIAGGQVCAIWEGNATCVTKAVCNDCNGLFGMYPSDTETIKEGPTSPLAERACMLADTCYKDLNNTAIELYLSCTGINSCAGYHTQTACETNQCQRSGNCTWRVTDQGTGRGVCGAAQPELGALNCADCNQGEGTCDATTCNAIGKAGNSDSSACAFVQGQVNPIPPNPDSMPLVPVQGCFPSTTVPCEFFLSQDACEGGQPYVLDTTYNAQNERIAGTNAITKPSKDLGEHGKCVWMNIGGTNVCRKDADKDGIQDWKQYPTTLIRQYSLDFESPVSSVIATPGIIYPADFSVPYTNTSPIWACFSRKGETPCYPTSQQDIAGQKISHHFDTDESGEWELRYYGMDAARNVEQIKTFSFMIDGQPPSIAVTITQDIVRLQQTVTTTTLKTRVTVKFTTSEPSFCSSELTDIYKSTVSSATRGGDNTDLVNAYGSSFATSYPLLADGVYIVKITCKDGNGNKAVKEVPLVVDTDGTITKPFPVQPTNPFNVTTIDIGVDTKEMATCKYGEEVIDNENDQSLWNRFTLYTTTSGLAHRATVTVADNRRYVYTTVCMIGSTLVRGGPADFIVFGIDRTSPATSICDANSDADCAPVTFGKSAPTATYRLKLVCTDTPVGSPSFGCTAKSVFFCLYKEGDTPCLLPVTGAPSGVATNTISGDKAYILRYRSIDGGGNAEPLMEKRIEPKDVMPPALPLFTVDP